MYSEFQRVSNSADAEKNSTRHENIMLRDRSLIARWRISKDENAINELLKLYHPFLFARVQVKLRRYSSFTYSELMNAARIGFTRAVDKYDFTKDVRISTYAHSWVRAKMDEMIMCESHTIRPTTTREGRIIFFKMAFVKREMARLGAERSDDEKFAIIAGKINVSPIVLERVYKVAANPVRSIDAPVSEDPDSRLFGDTIADDSPTPEDIVGRRDELVTRRQWLQDAMDVLNERERAIFEARRMTEDEDRPTLDKLAVLYGISKERVRQIENRSYEKIQAAVLQRSRQGRDALMTRQL